MVTMGAMDVLIDPTVLIILQYLYEIVTLYNLICKSYLNKAGVGTDKEIFQRRSKFSQTFLGQLWWFLRISSPFLDLLLSSYHTQSAQCPGYAAPNTCTTLEPISGLLAPLSP